MKKQTFLGDGAEEMTGQRYDETFCGDELVTYLGMAYLGFFLVLGIEPRTSAPSCILSSFYLETVSC